MGLHPMHVKSDSETSIEAASTPPRSPRRQLYYVQSPSHSQQLSFGSSPFASPPHNHQYHYHCSPIHHSRESSTSRLSNKGAMMAWKRMDKGPTGLRPLADVEDGDEEDDDEDEFGKRGGKSERGVRFYIAWFLLGFTFMFSVFLLILWAASLPDKPNILVKSIMFENFNVQAGMDRGGVPTDMLTLNSTVRVFFKNPATFFGVSIVSTPLELHYLELKLASGEMEKFYQPRKSHQIKEVVVSGHQVPMYGGVPALSGSMSHIETAAVPVNLTFYVRSRANILGGLVNTKFYRSIWCELVLRGDDLGKRINLTNSDRCVYR